MKIFRLRRTDDVRPGSYAAIVVVAKDAIEALKITPDDMGDFRWDGARQEWVEADDPSDVLETWTAPGNIDVELLGTAVRGSEARLVLTDFAEA